jgi:EpsI family protein
VKPWARWLPAGVLGLGALVTVGVDAQRALPLRRPLGEVVPATLLSAAGRDITISDAELAVAGVTDYLMRQYAPADSLSPAFTLYVGYYAQQMQGKTIHSPRNCLPGAGWEALASETLRVPTAAGDVVVNRYLLKKGNEQALVLYWYQGRGRVASNEYRVKWDLLRDAALKRRSDEALVRIVVPLRGNEHEAAAVATRAATAVMAFLESALPH